MFKKYRIGNSEWFSVHRDILCAISDKYFAIMSQNMLKRTDKIIDQKIQVSLSDHPLKDILRHVEADTVEITLEDFAAQRFPEKS